MIEVEFCIINFRIFVNEEFEFLLIGFILRGFLLDLIK